MNTKLCPCCSGHAYASCCKPFHEGAIAANALQLMRSRFVAYVFDKPDYIMETTHPASPQYSANKFSWKRAISRFSQSSVFNKLELLDFKEHGALATVVFTAFIAQQGGEATFTERSYFELLQGRWFYRTGLLAEGYVPQFVDGPLQLLPLAYYGDPVLRRKADPINEISSDIKELVEKMIETMDSCNGIGLAAPQVNHSLRLFITRAPREKEQGELEGGDVQVFINPTLSMPSEGSWKASEGCLSIPGMNGEVERPREITVEYTTLEGNKAKDRFIGWPARVIMHENDHINGVLFIDRLAREERTKWAPLLHALEKRIQGIRR